MYLMKNVLSCKGCVYVSAYKGPSYLCISCYIYCHLADSPINPQCSGEERTERNNGCFYTKASKQQLACISRHTGPMFLPRWSMPGVCGPPRSRDKQPPSISHYSVICPEMQPLLLSLFMFDPFSVIEEEKVSVLSSETRSFFLCTAIIRDYFLFHFVQWGHLCIKPFCPFRALCII